jgi:hypothetical protein
MGAWLDEVRADWLYLWLLTAIYFALAAVAAQRSEMRSMLADSGGAGLLVGLRQKTADLSGGILQ